MASWGAKPSDLGLTSLGVLQRIGSPYYKFLEYHQRMRIWRLLVEDWGSMQGASDADAVSAWQVALEILELDREAIEDIFLLVAQGDPGRAEANEILWTLLAELSLADPPHRDLSRKCSSMVTDARKRIDRPPRDHRDRQWWSWKKAIYPRDPVWAAAAVPRDPRLLTGPGGVPLRPPACWAPPPPPAPAPAAHGTPGPSRPSGASGSSGPSGPAPSGHDGGRPRRFG